MCHRRVYQPAPKHFRPPAAIVYMLFISMKKSRVDQEDWSLIHLGRPGDTFLSTIIRARPIPGVATWTWIVCDRDLDHIMVIIYTGLPQKPQRHHHQKHLLRLQRFWGIPARDPKKGTWCEPSKWSRSLLIVTAGDDQMIYLSRNLYWTTISRE